MALYCELPVAPTALDLPFDNLQTEQSASCSDDNCRLNV
jgi:hypothetical protein